MPSNQLPEDVRERVAAMIELVTIVPASLARTDAQEHEVVNDLVDAIAPLIIEWAREDQAEVDARIAKDGGTFWDAELGQYRSLYPAEVEAAIRAQFTPETTGGKTNG